MSDTHPEFVKALLKPEAYSWNPKKINLLETSTSYLFQADNLIYKIKKKSNEFSTLAVKEAFCHEEFKLSKRFNPNLEVEVLPVMEKDGNIKMGTKKGSPIEYALKMESLKEKSLLSNLLEKNTINVNHISKIATQIADIHSKSSPQEKALEIGHQEVFRSLCDDMLFQMKRYFDSSKTQPILDMIRHPLEKFIDENKKLFNKRQKMGRVVLGHGAFLPEHIFVDEKHVFFISPHEVQKNFSVMDVANDVSSLAVEFSRLKKIDLLELFLNQYLKISKDPDLVKMLPLYKTYCALKQGVKTCEMKVAQQNDELGILAMDYFHLAVRFSRDIPRS